jgi:hypothetical protein
MIALEILTPRFFHVEKITGFPPQKKYAGEIFSDHFLKKICEVSRINKINSENYPFSEMARFF